MTKTAQTQKSALSASHPGAIDVRFGQIGLIQLRLRTTDAAAILDDLNGRVASAPRFFHRTAVGVDLAYLPKAPEVAELRSVLDAVRQAGLVSVGLLNGSSDVEALASELDLPVLTSAQPQPQNTALVPVLQPSRSAEKTAVANPTDLALIHSRPVRSGQRLYARDRDLVVLANVGAGAEVMADGCVHVYGVLRGRALAGARGDHAARVFCQEFGAELISIAGIFRVFETLPSDLMGKPVHAWLVKEDLRLARIGAPK